MGRIKEVMTAALDDPTLVEAQADTLAGLLRESSARAAQQYTRSYIFFIALAALYTIVSRTGIETFTLFGVTVARSNPAVVLLPVLAAYSFYHAIAVMIFQQAIESGLDIYYSKRFPQFKSYDITDLLAYPSVVDVEHSIHTLSVKILASKPRVPWVILLMLLCLVMPLVWFGLATVWIVRTPDVGTLLEGVAVVSLWLFVTRSLWLIAATWRF